MTSVNEGWAATAGTKSSRTTQSMVALGNARRRLTKTGTVRQTSPSALGLTIKMRLGGEGRLIGRLAVNEAIFTLDSSTGTGDTMALGGKRGWRLPARGSMPHFRDTACRVSQPHHQAGPAATDHIPMHLYRGWARTYLLERNAPRQCDWNQTITNPPQAGLDRPNRPVRQSDIVKRRGKWLTIPRQSAYSTRSHHAPGQQPPVTLVLLEAPLHGVPMTEHASAGKTQSQP